MSAPRVVLVDIETSPNRGYTWGKYEQDVLKFDRPWELLSFAYKELGSKVTDCAARPDFRDKTDKTLTRRAWAVLDRADVVVGHNIDKFDDKKLKAKFVQHGMGPPSPYKTVDTLKIARQQFAFTSNSLNDLAITLGLGKKVKTGGIDLWFDCMDGDPAAWKRMAAYNRHDVVLLERVYRVLRSWYPSHPNLALYEGRPGCPVCASAKVHRCGVKVMKSRVAARFQCQTCAHWFSRSMKEAS